MNVMQRRNKRAEEAALDLVRMPCDIGIRVISAAYHGTHKRMVYQYCVSE